MFFEISHDFEKLRYKNNKHFNKGHFTKVYSVNTQEAS